MKMKSISGLGLGLSLVFGCLLLALIAELYYLLWWKKKIISKIDENGIQIPHQTSHFFYILSCFRNPNSPSSSQQLCNSSPSLVHEPSSSTSSKDLWLKQADYNNVEYFPRFLFTITEETREDLESRSNLGDQLNLIQILETPYLTPSASPPYFTPPLTPKTSFSEMESERDAVFNRVMRSSPPSKFKFLRDAEDKLVIQTTRRIIENGGDGDEFITLNICVGENHDEDEGICVGNNLANEWCSSSSSQVFNLVSSSSSSSTFR